MLRATGQRTVYLTPPRVCEEHIKEKITCIRAHKERIFEVSARVYGTKIVFNNYGQGGAGWTFLFGCVHRSLRQFEEYIQQNPAHVNQPIAVLGAGCYGLLTAIMLARKGYTVSIIAAATSNIPSYNAAGFFFPRPRKCSTPEEIDMFKQCGMESYTTYQSIIQGTHPFISHGPKLVPCYFGLDIDPGFAPYIEQGLIEPPEPVTINFGNGKSYDVMEYKTLFINTSAILHELQRNVIQLGITTTIATLQSFEDIETSIIFNCAGLGAKKLTGDTRIVPVQGHLITLKDQPDSDEHLNYMINVKVTQFNAQGIPRDELIYYAPKGEGILGVTFIRGQDSLTTNQHEFDRLLERCQEFFGVVAPTPPF